MVCETKIVAAEDHEALPGAKKDALLAAAGAMWPPLPAAPGPAAAPAAPPPAPGPQPLGGAGGAEPPEGRGVYIREIRAAEQEAARRIFYDGIMERIPNTAFRGLRHHPRTQLLYALLAGQCAGTPRGRRGRGRGRPGAPPPAAVCARPALWGRARDSLRPVRPRLGPGPRPGTEADPRPPSYARRHAPARSAEARGEVAPSAGAGPGSRPRRAGRGRGNQCGPGAGAAGGELGSPPASPSWSSRVGAG